MLETIDPSRSIDKEAYREWFPRLKEELADLQYQVREAGIPIVIIVEGWAMSGKSDCVVQLAQALDPRGFEVHTTRLPSEDEQRRHWMWRFWVRLPGRGRIAIFEKSWYTRVLEERIEGLCSEVDAEHAFQQVNQMEEMLARDGTLVLKFWLHIARKTIRERLEEAEKDPFHRFDVSKEDWRQHKKYEEYEVAVEQMLERTSSHVAPWIIVESGDDRYRRMKIFQVLCETISTALAAAAARKEAPAPPAGAATPRPAVPALREMPSILDSVNLTRKLSESAYEKRKASLSVELRQLQLEMIEKDVPLVVVFEGWDAAGKGGTIRRLALSLDARYYDVIPVAKPTPEEKAHHYLWRFWKQVPKQGHVTIYDRSWYGRVLVERIEGFCTEEEWRRAYQEINEFELQLYRSGVALAKFWLHISPEEQLRRFKEREADPHKRWKLSPEDWRNRDKWPQYREAVEEMLQRTSTTYAPWTIVEAECKQFGRVRTLETVARVMQQALKRRGK